MGFLDRFKRRRRTFNANFSSYRNPRFSNRKPFEPKIPGKMHPLGTWGKIFRVLRILGILFMLGALFYLMFFTNFFEVQKINVTGESDTLQEQAALNNSLQDYLGENLLTVNVPLIEAELLKKYPYLKTLDVRRDFFHTLTVVLKTHANLANVRVEYENGSEQFFVVNEQGYISGIGVSDENLPTLVMDVTSTEATLPNTEEALPNSEDTSNSNDSSTETSEENKGPHYALNEELIPKDTLALLLETAKNFEGKFNMQVLEIQYLKQARELHLYTERHFNLWLDLTQDLGVQLTKLKKALTTLNIYEADLEYIDLRISGQNGEKVIYRLRH